jgi:polysaccharide export outer membrane protein
MNQFRFLFLSILIISFLSSCISEKKLYYFHNQITSVDASDSLRIASRPVIQIGDRISAVVSCQDPAQTAFLNPFNSQNSGSNAIQQGVGYLINQYGAIDFPLVGQIKLVGLNSDQAADKIKQELKSYFKDPYVYVYLPGKVYFMNGRNGAAIPILNERITIFEVIAQSGIQDAFDRKNKTWVVREEDGHRYYQRIDLNDKSIFNSPYYYLHNNDLVYMEPGRLSAFFTGNSPVRNILSITTGLLALYFALTR